MSSQVIVGPTVYICDECSICARYIAEDAITMKTISSSSNCRTIGIKRVLDIRFGRARKKILALAGHTLISVLTAIGKEKELQRHILLSVQRARAKTLLAQHWPLHSGSFHHADEDQPDDAGMSVKR